MRVAQGKRNHVNYTVAAHNDGSISVGIAINRRPAKEVDGKMFSIADAEIQVPMELNLNGMMLKPKLIVKCYFKPNKHQRERLKLKQLMSLCKT